MVADDMQERTDTVLRSLHTGKRKQRHKCWVKVHEDCCPNESMLTEEQITRGKGRPRTTMARRSRSPVDQWFKSLSPQDKKRQLLSMERELERFEKLTGTQKEKELQRKDTEAPIPKVNPNSTSMIPSWKMRNEDLNETRRLLTDGLANGHYKLVNVPLKEPYADEFTDLGVLEKTLETKLRVARKDLWNDSQVHAYRSVDQRQIATYHDKMRKNHVEDLQRRYREQLRIANQERWFRKHTEWKLNPKWPPPNRVPDDWSLQSPARSIPITECLTPARAKSTVRSKSRTDTTRSSQDSAWLSLRSRFSSFPSP